jgi:DNA adenine methylase
MSINDRPEVREIFGRFDLTEVETSYSVGAKGGSRGGVRELLVAKYR